MSVLVVESRPGVGRSLRDQLRDHGVEVTSTASLRAARDMLCTQTFGTVVVDHDLLDGSGLDVVDAVRQSDVLAHVIVLSASADDSVRAEAIRRGATDVVVTPVSTGDLAARVLAVPRPIDAARHALIQIGALTVDLSAKRVTLSGRLVELTSKEFDLLAYLAARPGHAFSRTELLRAVWKSEPEWQQVAVITEYVSRLRAKIESDPRRPLMLRTVRGTGYRLDLPADAAHAAHDVGPSQKSTLVHISGRIVWADRTVWDMLGLAEDADLVGHQIVEMVTAPWRAATRERMSGVGRNNDRRTQLVELERHDATTVLVEVASQATDWHGQDAGLVTFTSVPDSPALLRRLVTGVLGELTDAVIITDLHWHIRSWNPAAERLYGWRQQETLGRHILDVIRWGGEDDALAVSQAELDTHGRWKGVARQLTRDGSSISVLASTTVIRDDAGEAVVIVSVNRLTPVARPPMCAYDGERIRAGLANDEFEVYYQPVVMLEDSRVVAMEALVRWNHPDVGLLHPPSFIAEAERSGYIVELGHRVLQLACRQIAEWRHAGFGVELAVNLSARELSAPNLFERVMDVLSESGLDPSTLWLEVTETALVEEVSRASEVLYRLASAGIGLAIDDFGTGWASLTYLRTFPIHALKIDRSFVSGVGRNANDTAIVRSILSLGAELGLIVIAEGIETPTQHKALQRLGCTMAQGFLHGQPQPAVTAAVGRARPIGHRPQHPVRARRHAGAGALRRAPLVPTVDQVVRLRAERELAAEGSGTHDA